MPTLIFKTIARFLLPLMLLISVFVLVRGHNATGGGFVGGLVASAAFVLYALAFDIAAARRILHADPLALIGVGLLTALASGVLSLLAGEPFMTGLWTDWFLPGLGTLHLGTPLVFDTGVYLAVLGVTLTIVLSLEEQ